MFQILTGLDDVGSSAVFCDDLLAFLLKEVLKLSLEELCTCAIASMAKGKVSANASNGITCQTLEYG